MGKRHNTLDYKYFHKTNYIKALEKEYNIANFKKEYELQFNIMYDVFKTLIVLNNIIFADSNKNKDDKVYELIIELEKCLYGDLDNDSDRYKYSVRQINDLLDKHTRYLFKKFIEWYEYLNNISKLDNVKVEIEEEMHKLTEIKFDYIVEDNMLYKKNKDSKQSLYITKFFKYNADEEFIKQYINDYYDENEETLDEESLKEEISLIYNLVAFANNGIIKQLYSVKDLTIDDLEFDLETITPNLDDVFETYFKNYLHLNFNDLDEKKVNAEYIKEVSKVLMYFILNADEFNLGEITELEIYQNYDLYNFMMNIYRIINNEIMLKNSSSKLKKIIEKLKQIFELINNDKDFKGALVIINGIIVKNKDIYIRIS